MSAVRQPPTYLGSMTPDERAMAIVLSILGCGVTAHELYKGGYTQFMRVSRPPLKDWGIGSQDLAAAWELIVVAHHFPSRFKRLAQTMQYASEQHKKALKH